MSAKALSKGMAQKAADSGLLLCHLLLSFHRGGRDGIVDLFSDKTGGAVRVTRSSRICDSVLEFIEDLSKETQP